MSPVREAWTDERLDDLSSYVQEGFREMRADVRGARGEIGELRGEIGMLRSDVGGLDGLKEEVGGLREGVGELRGEVGGLRGEMNARFDTLERHMQMWAGVFAAILVAILGLVGTQL